MVAAESTASFGKLATISKRFARRLLTIGENRPELLRVEVQEESERLQQACLCVVGTGNNWHPKAKAMHPLGNGRWLKETVLPPSNYEYSLVVDGRWIPDPLARETLPNPFDGRNSLLKVTRSLEITYPTDAKTCP